MGRLAVIIANKNYRYLQKLNLVKTDSDALSKLLIHHGFHVEILEVNNDFDIILF